MRQSHQFSGWKYNQNWQLFNKKETTVLFFRQGKKEYNRNEKRNCSLLVACIVLFAPQDMPGNTSPGITVLNVLEYQVIARDVRFVLKEWVEYVSVRLEVYGCESK